MELLTHYGVTYCQKAPPHLRQAEGRIITPIYRCGLLQGWQGRWPDDLNWKETNIPKYYTMPGFQKATCLYNMDTAQRYNLVIVTEGVTDAWATGPWAVALLGKTLSQPQQGYLMQSWNREPVVLMLDPTEANAMRDMQKRLLRHAELRGGPVCIVQLPDGRDPGSYQGCQQELLAIVRAQCAAQGVVIPEKIERRH